MENLGLIINLDNAISDKCITCSKCKITRNSFTSVQRSSNVLGLVHTNICEMTDTLSRGGKRYFISFIDDASKYTHVFLLRTKDEAFEKFKTYKVEVENLLDLKIKVLRSDRGGEYIGYEFIKFCEDCRIHRETSTPYTLQQNGVAERNNHTLTELVNVMMINSRACPNLWGEPLMAACHILN